MDLWFLSKLLFFQDRKSSQGNKSTESSNSSSKKLRRQSPVLEAETSEDVCQTESEGQQQRPPLSRTQSLRENVKFRRNNSIKRIKRGASRVWHSVKVKGNK